MCELNQDTAGVLARVERGETVEITRLGRVIARSCPPAWVSSTTGSLRAGQLLRELRDEERW